MADRAGLLAVPRETRGGQGIERHALVATGQGGLRDAGSAEDALQRSDVEVLTRMRAGHDRDLGGLEIEFLDPAGLDQRDDAERLDGRPESDQPLGIAERPDEATVDVGLDDVAPVDALLDAVPQLPDEHWGIGSRADSAPCPTVPRGRALCGEGHPTRIPRRHLGGGVGCETFRWVDGPAGGWAVRAADQARVSLVPSRPCPGPAPPSRASSVRP